MANLYKIAGVVNITSSYLPPNSSSSYVDTSGNKQVWAGDNICGPSTNQSSSVLGYIGQFPNSLNTIVDSLSEYNTGIVEKPLLPPNAPVLLGINVVGDPTLVIDFVVLPDETYTISLSDTFGNPVVDINGLQIQPIVSTVSPVTFYNVTDNSIYILTIIATNDVGDSHKTQSSNITVQTTIPSPPTISSIETTETSILVNFNVNTDNLFTYELTLSNLLGKIESVQTTKSPVLFIATDKTTLYYVSITATNSLGTSLPTKSSTIMLKTLLPNQPDIKYVTISKGLYTYKFIDPNVLAYQLSITNTKTSVTTISRLTFNSNSYTSAIPTKSGTYVLSLIAFNNAGSSEATISNLQI